MFEAILRTMAGVLSAADEVNDVRRDSDFSVDAEPFSEEEYDANLAASVKYETTLAVRKAHTRLKQGYPDEALTPLVICRKRLPQQAEAKMLDSLILQLHEAQRQ